MADSQRQELDELAATLDRIAGIKNALPLQLRPWTYDLGLRVRLREAFGRERLQAGGTFRNYFIAGRELWDDEWEVRKFDKQTWERRFAHLVAPTEDIALFLVDRIWAIGRLDDKGASFLAMAIKRYKATEQWLGLSDAPPVPEKERVRRQAEREEDARLRNEESQRQEKAERSRRISDYEELMRSAPENLREWALLPFWYELDGRFKDLENCLQRIREVDPKNDADAYRQLGKLYLAALSSSVRGKGIPLSGYVACTVPLDVLGYSVEELRSLAIANLKTAIDKYEGAGWREDNDLVMELHLAYRVAQDLSDQAFADFDAFSQARRERDRLRMSGFEA